MMHGQKNVKVLLCRRNVLLALSGKGVRQSTVTIVCWMETVNLTERGDNSCDHKVNRLFTSVTNYAE